MTTKAPRIALPALMTGIHISGDDMEMTLPLMLTIIFCALGGSFVGLAINFFVLWLLKLPPFDCIHE
jgi:hypothetical protein